MSTGMHDTRNEEPAADLPTSDRAIRRIGYAVLFVTFGLFGSWATFAPLDSAALASGVVTVKSYRKTVQHLEGGIVRALHVRDGDQVAAGQVLIELDDTQAAAELEMVRSQLIAARALEARLLAERDDRDAVTFAEGEPADRRVREAQDGEAQIFRARRSSRLGEVDVLNKRIVQLEEQVRGFQAVIAGKQELSRSYGEEVGDLRALLSEGFVDKQRLREQERSLAQLRAEIADLHSSIARARLQIGETQLQILQLNKEFAAEVADQLATAQTKVFDLRERLAAAEDRARRTRIRAPEAGMVLGLQVHTVGGVVSPATPLLDIVPASEELVVEVQISPIDIDRVAPGKLADIRFSAFNHATTPVIEGRLAQVSADRLVNQETGVPYYLGRVELTEQGRRDLGQLLLVPGMPAEVLLNTGERTLLSYLVQPATNAFARSLIED
ncbi:HlyD family type I secretion periplasmic adaptor subunit [Pseudomonas sp. GCM10022188]|uniref:HlyD family type I secretion periplasmic adaptor subunit n=1 Tax=Pseudomonas TaxID=286 RepID=UPI001E58369F|nr:HlyD family type I secretion periplasmic adaptor subunit [Pseudomonas oryzagri]MCC6075764.1 HlyD family type I secretion periplasmic adaptor subunit [Pseudomonas oryzagri]